jgi:hypothetical protein
MISTFGTIVSLATGAGCDSVLGGSEHEKIRSAKNEKIRILGLLFIEVTSNYDYWKIRARREE